MFRLVKNLHSGHNAPEPMRVTLSTPVTQGRGILFTLENGEMVKATATSKSIPTHLLLSDAVEDTEILCTLIPVGAVFSTAVTEEPADLKVGSEYMLSADGEAVSATLAAGEVRGVCIFDACGARHAGEEILVTLPIR